MPVKPGEVYYLDKEGHRLRESQSGRYVLVLRVAGGVADIGFFSSRFDLFSARQDVPIYEEWQEFPATGLKVSCYLVHGETEQIAVSELKDHRGKVEGAFKKLVEDWWGEPL